MPVRANFTPFDLLARRLADIDGMAVKVGIVGAAAAQLEDDSDLTLAELWQIHEYGTADGHIPERAPLRKTFIAHRADLAATYRKAAYGVLTGKLTASQALGLIGLRAKTLVQQTIVAGLTPPLATSTILRKGSTKPLVDHGQLYRSVDYEIAAAEGKAAAASVALSAASEAA
jgi:hypothetical protein